MGSNTQTWAAEVAKLGDQLLALLPQLLAALALLLIGWLLARVLRAATQRGALLLDTVLARTLTRTRGRIGRSAKLLGNVVY